MKRRDFLKHLSLSAAALSPLAAQSQMFNTAFWARRTQTEPTALSRGTALDTNTYRAAFATENNNYGSGCIWHPNGDNGLDKTVFGWTPSGASSFLEKCGPLDNCGSGETLRLTTNSITRNLNSGIYSGSGPMVYGGTIRSSALFSSGSRVAVLYDPDGLQNAYLLSIWDTSTLPYTFGGAYGVGDGKVCVINDTYMVICYANSAVAYTTSFGYIGSVVFDSSSDGVLSVCAPDYTANKGVALCMYTKAGKTYARSLKVTATSISVNSAPVEIYGSVANSFASILPIPHFRAIAYFGNFDFKVLSCTDWSSWDGTADGAVATAGYTFNWMIPFGSTTHPRFYAQRDNNSNPYGMAMSVSGTTINFGTPVYYSGGYSGSSRANMWARF